MKHYVILTASFTDGTGEKKAIYEYATADEAIANFHCYMGTYMQMANIKKVLVLAINDEGGIYKNESYKKDVSEDA